MAAVLTNPTRVIRPNKIAGPSAVPISALPHKVSQRGPQAARPELLELPTKKESGTGIGRLTRVAGLPEGYSSFLTIHRAQQVN
jgi:hypothetical protein